MQYSSDKFRSRKQRDECENRLKRWLNLLLCAMWYSFQKRALENWLTQDWSRARARALSATGPYHSVTETGLWGNTWPCHYLAALALFPLPLLPFVRFLTFPFHTMRREIGRVYLHPASTHVWHAGFRLCLTLMKGALCLLRRGIQAATFCGSWMCVRRCANIFFLSLEKQRKGKRWSFKVYLLLWGDALPVRR